ncbi:MAG: NADH-quinone oxidoreductase subunit L, partial [Brevundimonas sp.]|nr:NADH-quinone oxidoreductase subunit L [Brevundimonas sp.]
TPNGGTIVAICLLLLVGAFAKSAQLPLHTWLPDAMEGPTPVSALIHAATMVTAGGYMVCLLSPIYEYAPVASAIIAVVGAVTALFAATVGLAQNDIKRVIAYSTCSQLGYMFFAAGVGAYQAAMFHLFTHAFFKALLFLGAGSVIHGMHHEQDMRKMGGLWKLLPVTYAVMTIGTIAITGLGIPGVGGLAGFYSKDSIIESAFASFSNGHSAIGLFAFFVGILAAGLTAYYSWRLVFMTFHNKPVWKDAHHDDHAHDDHASHAQLETHDGPLADDGHAHDDHADHGPLKPHESPLVMLVPLLLLAVGAIAAGFVFAPWFIGDHEHDFWRGAIFVAESNHVLHDSHYVPVWVKWSPLILTLIGTFAAFWLYVLKEGMARRMADRGGVVHGFLYNKWYFDEIYDAVFVKGARAVGDLFWKVGDVKIIDGGGPNGIAWLSRKFAGGLGRFQSGYVYFYAFVMLLGLAGFLAFAIHTWGA